MDGVVSACIQADRRFAKWDRVDIFVAFSMLLPLKFSSVKKCKHRTSTCLLMLNHCREGL